MTVTVVGSVILVVCGLLFLLSMPGSVCAAGPCPDLPSGGGQSMSATAKTVATSCPVTDGMYVRKNTQLRLDSIATADGQCQITGADCNIPGCPCLPVPTIPPQERVIGGTTVRADITAPPLNGTYTLGFVYGKKPDGTTAFLHVLDSTQPNSTGPVNFLVYFAGEYLIHFQANINTTSCNILPATTPTYDIMVHARTALHRGERNNGSLVGGMSLPDPGTGYYQDPVNDVKNEDDWGGAEAAIRLIQTVGTQWSQLHPAPLIGILDISRKPTGGSFPPHTEHQNGLDIDVRYVRNDGISDRINLADPNQFPKYDRDLTIELMRLFATNGSLYRILVSSLSTITSADVPGVNIVQMSGHDDHFHVSLVDPDGTDTNNCP